MGLRSRIFSLLIMSVWLLVSGTNADNDIFEANKDTVRQGKDYYPSHYTEEEKSKFNGYAEYPPNNYVTYKEEAPVNCAPSPLMPILNNGLNFLLLKLGAIGIIKAVLSIIFLVFLFKLPIFLAKMAFFKAILFPAFMAPLMMLFSGTMGSSMMNAMMSDPPKPSGGTGDNAASTDGGSGRALEDAITKFSWKGFRLLLDSERCAERMACQFGVYNNDTVSGESLARMAKYIEHSSPSSARFRIRSIREAFSEGNSGGICPYDAYPCQSPKLILSQGDSNLRVL